MFTCVKDFHFLSEVNTHTGTEMFLKQRLNQTFPITFNVHNIDYNQGTFKKTRVFRNKEVNFLVFVKQIS